MIMKKAITALSVSLLATGTAIGEETRELDAHEHGVGALNIAIDGKTVAMEFHAPGADIVGFEYKAESDADISKIEQAKTALSEPKNLFFVPPDAACTVTNASVELKSDDHGSEKEHEHDEHDHGHEEHEHEDHAGHEDDHDDHAGEDGHTEFHAEYAMTCENPDALTTIDFAYFSAFPNAREVEVQIVTPSGARAFEVERDAPKLYLGS